MEEKWTPESHPELFDPNIKTPGWKRFENAVEKEIKRLQNLEKLDHQYMENRPYYE